jgi:hypothetical protein
MSVPSLSWQIDSFQHKVLSAYLVALADIVGREQQGAVHAPERKVALGFNLQQVHQI